MLRRIKKAYEKHKQKQKNLRRIAHNQQQHKLIYEGLEERGY